MPTFESRIDTRSDEFKANAQAMGAMVEDLRTHVARAAAGGGETARAKHTARGKLLPRARIDHAVRTDERVDVRLRRPVPVYWVYMTAWATDDGLVQFREDIYKRDEQHIAGDFSAPATPFDPVGPQAFAPGQRGPSRVN